MNFKALILTIFLFVFTVPTKLLAQSNESDGALNAIQTILGLTGRSRLPQCGLLKQKSLRFCPLVANCPTDKPFCVLKSEKKAKSRRVTLSCVCATSPVPTPTPTPTATPTGTVIPTPDSGVRGKITLSNTCGGAVYVDQVCNSPYVGKYMIYSNPGLEKLFEGETSSDGTFSKSLAPGNYYLAAGPFGEMMTSKLISVPVPPRSSVDFTVTAGKFTDVTLDVDSGIRLPPIPQNGSPL